MTPSQRHSKLDDAIFTSFNLKKEGQTAARITRDNQKLRFVIFDQTRKNVGVDTLEPNNSDFAKKFPCNQRDSGENSPGTVQCSRQLLNQ